MHPDASAAPLHSRLYGRGVGLVRRPPAALVSLFDQGLVSGFGFLSGIAAARLLGIAEFGHFAMILIAISFAQGLQNALIAAPMMTLAGARGSVSKGYGANILAAAIVLSIPGALFVLVPLILTKGISHGSVLAACGLMLAQNLQFVLRRLLFARGRGMQALAMDFVRAASFPLAAGLIWLQHGAVGITGFTWIMALTGFVASLPFAVAAARPALRDPSIVHLGVMSRRHAPIARWLLPIVFVTFAQEQLIWIIAGYVLGLDALGGLRAAQYLVGPVVMAFSAVENVLPVKAARAFAEGGESALRRYMLKTGLRVGAPIVAILVVLGAPAELWLTLIFGPDFAPYAASLRLMAASIVIIMVRDLLAHYFRAKHNTRVMFESLGVSMLVSLAVAMPALTYAGVNGAVVAVTAGHVASLIYLVIAARLQFHPMPVWLARAR